MVSDSGHRDFGETTQVASFPLDDSSELVFYIWEKSGKRYGGMRKWVALGEYFGPSKAGIVVNSTVLREIIDVLDEVTGIITAELPKEGTVSGRIRKNKTTEVVVSFVESTSTADSVMLDIREFVESDRYTGPTKKGIRLPCDCIGLVRDHLAKLDERLQTS